MILYGRFWVITEVRLVIKRCVLVSVAAAITLGTFTGCGNTATITRTQGGGGVVEAKIVSSDGNKIFVEGGRAGIPRDEIVDIDHPGNGAAVAGGLLSAYGILNIAVGIPQCEEKGAGFCTGVFLPLAVGLPLTIYGIVVYAGSTSAASQASARRAAQPRFHPAPMLGRSGSLVSPSGARSDRTRNQLTSAPEKQ